jgi:hypothetical protein
LLNGGLFWLVISGSVTLVLLFHNKLMLIELLSLHFLIDGCLIENGPACKILIGR